MIYGSVCSGMCATTQAWEPLGLTPAFFAEIEAFPVGVLAHRFRAGRPRNLVDPAGLSYRPVRTWWVNRQLVDTWSD